MGHRARRLARRHHAGLPGSTWAQYASGALGLAVVVAWAVLVVVRRPRRPRPARVPWLSGRPLAGAVALAGLVGGAAAVLAIPRGFHSVAYAGAAVGTVTLAFALVAGSALWQVALRRSSPRS